MKISLSLLKKFISIDKPAKEIAETLTMLGLEVDSIENDKALLQGVVVAKVEEVEKHPKAEKLLIVKVSDGKNKYQVVCGDTSLKADSLVPFAKIGAKAFDKNSNLIQIEKTEIRTISSDGMLLSAKEMHLFEEDDKVLRLPSDEFCVGEDLSKKFFDPIFDISLTPNLGHCMSAIGVARELSGVLKLKMDLPKHKKDEKVKLSNIQIDITDGDACKKYAAKVLENIEVKDSPFWLKKSLMQCGIRSINNVVDVTNYVMLLLGQPLHAFDLNAIDGSTIKIGFQKNKEKLLALDANEYELDDSILVIQDENKTLAVAGVIGSEESSVTPKTKNILLEAAYFSPKSIRHASKLLNLRTESSQRFEKGTDYEMVSFALEFASALLLKTTNAKASATNILEKSPLILKEVILRKNRVNAIIGHPFSLSEITSILKLLNLTCHTLDPTTLQVKIPSYRNDLNEEIDLIEEVLRIYGINNIKKMATFYTSTKIKHSKMFNFENNFRKALIAENLLEVINSDLISLKAASLFKEGDLPNNTYIHVKHFKSEEHSILRPSLLCSLLPNIKHNLDHKNTDLAFFEMGKIHFQKDNAFVEQKMCAVALSGKKFMPHFSTDNREVDFFDIKGIVENLFEKANVKTISFISSNHSNFHPTRQANIFVNNIEIGVIGELNPKLLSQLDIKQRVYYSEININLLLKLQSASSCFQPIPTYPGSDRDWTFTIDKNQLMKDVFDAIESQKPPILEKVDLISIFESDQIGKNKKNVTLRFYYRDPKQTLSYEQTEENHNLLKRNVASFLKIATNI